MGSNDTTIGPLLVGIFFNTFLYGLVTYQFVLYRMKKFNDPPITRCMVLFLFILDTLHSASAMYMAWHYVVTNYDNPKAMAVLKVADWAYAFTPLATALAALVTQMYLGFRIWRLTSSKFLFGAVILLAIPSFVMGMMTSINAWTINVLSKVPQFNPASITWLAMQTTVDTLITVTLIITFSRLRTGFRRTDTILNRFIRGAIQTGLFADIFAFSDMTSRFFLPHTSLYIMFAIPLGRIYTNTLMDTLLSRELLVVKLNSGEVVPTAQIDSVFWMPTDSQGISGCESSIP